MREWLLTSTLPYWLVFLMVLVSTGICVVATSVVKAQGNKLLSFGVVVAVTALIVVGVVCEWAIYLSVKNECLWWIESKEIGFFSRLFRAIPLFLFLTAQIVQIKLYKSFVEKYLQKDGLNVRGIIKSTVYLFPAMFVLYMLLNLFGMGKPMRDYVFYACFIIGLIAGMGRSLVDNIATAGVRRGVAFSVVAIVIMSGAVVSVMLLSNVVLTLFFQLLVYSAFVLLMMQVVPAMNNQISITKPNRLIFRDDAGTAHYTAHDRDVANVKIKEGKSSD